MIDLKNFPILFLAQTLDPNNPVLSPNTLQQRQWITGYYVGPTMLEDGTPSGPHYLISVTGNGYDRYMIDPRTLRQYQRVTDCNGYPLFTGDIVRTSKNLYVMGVDGILRGLDSKGYPIAITRKSTIQTHVTKILNV